MLKNFVIIRKVVSFIIPYIVLYAFYIELNGESSPGGGFQAGVIFASGIIAFDLIKNYKETKKFFSSKVLCICAVLGVIIYATTGLVSLFFGDNYLNYYSIAKIFISTDLLEKQSLLKAQHIGIFAVEIGVGLTVASTMCLIYLTLRQNQNEL